MGSRLILSWMIAAMLVLSGTGSVLADTIRGTVYSDDNGNGRRDRGEAGIEGVVVSNQIEVTTTNADGRYELPARDPMVVFVTQPDGYRVPVNDDNLPRFHYVHDSDGSDRDVDWHFRPISPTGELPESVDFPLLPWEHPRRFNLIAMADPQPRTDREIDFVRDDVASELVNTDAALAVVLGDIMFDDLALFERQNRVFSVLGCPVWYVPGNHDINFEAPDDASSLETFKRIYGPTYYSMNYGDVHFMTLENVHYNGRGANLDPDRYKRGGGYSRGLGDTQLGWIEEDLKHVPMDKLIVINTHIPVAHFVADGVDDDIRDEMEGDRQALFDLLEGRRYILILSGHTHTNDHVHIDHRHGWHGEEPIHQHVVATVSGTWWQGPLDERGIPIATMRDGGENGYVVYTFDGTDYACRFKAAGKDDEFQMRIMLEEQYQASNHGGVVYEMPGVQGTHIRQEQLYSTNVVVNVFNGAEWDKVWLRVDDRTPVELTHTIRYDPYFMELKMRAEHEAAAFEMGFWGKQRSSHIWQGDLPEDLEPGVHTLHVRWEDQFGQVWDATRVFEVTAP